MDESVESRIVPTPVLIDRLREHAASHSDSKDLLYAAADRLEELLGESAAP